LTKIANFFDSVAFEAAQNTEVTLNFERDLVRSKLQWDMIAGCIRTSPMRALQIALGRDEREAETQSPFLPQALLYHDAVVETVRQAGIRVRITTSLPLHWVQPALDELGLDCALSYAGPQDIMLPQTAMNTPPSQQHSALKTFAKALRLHQWSKNVLIFTPLAMSHMLLVPQAFANTFIAFLSFGLLASAIYLLNDLLDLPQDRNHPVKRNRPFASGALPVSYGLVLIPLLSGASILLCATLPPLFMMVLGAYGALNLAYSFYLKRKLLLDVFALAGAYILRVLAGNAAGPVELSHWLLAFTLFLFFSLALVKRYIELDTVEPDRKDEKRIMGRGYRRSDLDMISQLGVASAFSSVVVLALYVNDARAIGLYHRPELIWLVVPIVLYVMGRIWVLAKRSELPDDPVLFIIKDWRSHLMAAIVASIIYLAI
jgi:4-hydroxybenzoate polyprenyltransferase